VGNDNFVFAVCSNADEECCWLKHYEGVEKTINDRPNFQAEITEAFQESHFGRSEGALGLHLAHVMSWSDIRCRLDGLFEQAFKAEENSETKDTKNYAKIKEFLTKLFEIDGDAVVHDGGWYPPLTKEGWNNPNSLNWFEQFPTKRQFRRLGNPKCNSNTWDSYDSGCCSTSEPCGIGEGDCDNDSDCQEGLSCGDNNCVGTGFTKQADCCYGNATAYNDGDYMSEILVELRNEYLKEAIEFFDEGNIDFWKETHPGNDDPLDIKEQNGESIRKLFQLANAASTNLRYGDGSSNSAIQENFDPMGDKDGVVTKKETEMLRNWVVNSDVRQFPQGTGDWYIRSSTGLHQPDPTFKNRWYIKCLEQNKDCY